MPETRFSVEVIGGVPVVTTPEEIDMINAPRLRAVLADAVAHGPGPVVVDMSRTQFCDSAGLHALIGAHKQAQAKGHDVLAVVPATTVLRVFAITGLDRIIPNFSTLHEALAQASATRPLPATQHPAAHS
jgi:anti-sigma B factor antagonist